MLKADMGSEAMASGLKPEVDAPKRFSSQQCVITLCLARARTAGSRPREYEKSKNKPRTSIHCKMPIIILPALKFKFVNLLCLTVP